MITKTLFDTYDGKSVYLYTLSNPDISVGILDFGATVNFIKLNTAKGEKNIAVGYDCVQGYIDSSSYCGTTVGRVANRISGAKFSLDGKQYRVSANEGKNCLHGGQTGFDKRFFSAEINGDTLVLRLVSEDGDMGFPGRLKFEVRFTLAGRELMVKYGAVSDKATLFAPTSHIYFNLNGGGEVMDNLLKINANSYTPVDDSLIPLGTVESVEGTPFDFTSLKKIGEDYEKLGGKTYDNNFCLKGEPAATAQSITGDVTVDIYTDMPGLQFYVGKPAAYEGRGGGCGFCLEPQYFPNAINVEGFESPVIGANEQAGHYVRYLFGFHS